MEKAFASLHLGKELKSIPFSGREGDWKRWSHRFLQQANAAGLIKMMTDPAVVKPSYSMVRLYNALSESVPEDWSNKFMMMDTVKLAVQSLTENKEDDIEFMDTPHPAVCFKLLRDSYEKSNSVTKGALWKVFNGLKMDPNRPFEDFAYAINFQVSKLEGTGEIVTSANKLQILFEGVTRDADQVVAALERRVDPSFKDACEELEGFYSRIEARRKRGQGDSAQSHSAFHANSHSPVDSRCSFCDRLGHSEEKCWKKHPENRPEGFCTVKPKLQQKHHSSQQRCRSCRKFGHGEKDCPRKTRKTHPSSDLKSRDRSPAPLRRAPRARGRGQPNQIPIMKGDGQKTWLWLRWRFYLLVTGVLRLPTTRRSLFWTMEPRRISATGNACFMNWKIYLTPSKSMELARGRLRGLGKLFYR